MMGGPGCMGMMGMADHIEGGSLKAKLNITEAQRCTGPASN
jgi:hypothetical protein